MGLLERFLTSGDEKNKTDSSGADSSPTLSPDEEYIAVKHDSQPAGHDWELIQKQSGGNLELISAQMGFLMRHSSRFRTLKEHVRRLQQYGWQNESPGFIQDCFRELMHRGLLRSKTEFIDGLRSRQKSSETPPPITTIAWITCDRIEALKRSLQSFHKNNQDHGRKLNYAVFDDAPEPETRRKTREMLSALAGEKNIQVFYAGEEEKRSFAADLDKKLKSDGAPEGLLEFALFDPLDGGLTIGANRNALLLGLTGELILSADDDSVCELALPLHGESGTEISSFFNPTEMYFFPKRADLLGAITKTAGDLVGRHESILGRDLTYCLNTIDPGSETDITRLGGEFLGQLERSEMRVQITAAGVFGDSGMDNVKMLMALRGRSRESLMRSPQNYFSAAASREVMRIVPKTTFSGGAFFGGFNIGMDNRLPTIPFIPLQRNEDILFGVVLRTLFPETLIAHLPVALLHDPINFRLLPANTLLNVRPSISEIIILFIQAYLDNALSNGTALSPAGLGAYFKEISSLEREEYERLFRRRWLDHVSAFITYLENLLSNYDHKPEFWARDVESYMDALRKFSAGKYPSVPVDLISGRRLDEAHDLSRLLIYQFGELLIWWPRIFQLAREMRENRGEMMIRL